MTETALIQGLRDQAPAAQKRLYDHYGPRFFALCRRYLRRREDAEEALVSGLYKIITSIDRYEGKGSFEGWMRRVVVNEALMLLRKAQPLDFPGEVAEHQLGVDQFSIDAELSARDILELLDQLPTGYRTVFNLYVLEGFKHQEIADLLGISVNTSKSQLLLAKEKLKTLLIKKGYGPTLY